jgi:glycine/D-amino acid oxidase-like deaminating enzyme
METAHAPGSHERLDDGATKLRAGATVWQEFAAATQDGRTPQVLETDVVIIGAGITGAFLAERFTRSGRGVVLIDRRAPASGSTAASTAMLLWELDLSLLELEDALGFEAAASIASQCIRAVQHIGRLVGGMAIDCDFRKRRSLFLAGNNLDAVDLRAEHAIRARMDIEGSCLDSLALNSCGYAGDAALLYPGAAEVDPVRLARGLLSAAVARGAIILSPAHATIFDTKLSGVVVETHEGDVVRAGVLVLANGYEMPDFVDATRHRMITSWAVASKRMAPRLSPSDLLVWEASDPYLYLRSTFDGRVIAGGEDEPITDVLRAAEMIDEKADALRRRVEVRCSSLRDLDIAFGWAGIFGETEDSLPMIGRVPGKPNCLAAFGYGGNGITFSAIAAEALEAQLEGRNFDNARFYALDRD